MANENKLAYVIQEEHFEYNDEIYHRGNHGDSGGYAKKVYFDLEAANTACRELNRQKIKSVAVEYGGLGQYTYEPNEILNEGWEQVFDDPDEILGLAERDFYSTVNKFKELTDEQWDKFMDFVNLDFYQVYEVEFVD